MTVSLRNQLRITANTGERNNLVHIRPKNYKRKEQILLLNTGSNFIDMRISN